MSEEVLHVPLRIEATNIPVRQIQFADVRTAIAEGIADFLAKPSHVIFLSIIYPIVGIVIAQAVVAHALLPIVFPLVAGFAILGPFAAIGTYEVSRRRELGADTSWADLRELARSSEVREIVEMAVLLLVIFVAWLGAAEVVYKLTLGPEMPGSVGVFVWDVLTTPRGWSLIVVGNAVGFAFAAVAFAVGLISFPLIIDRKVSFGTAVMTSVHCVARNPVVLAGWGAIVAATIAGGMALLFVGLAIVLPILGHASWHLYRKLVP